MNERREITLRIHCHNLPGVKFEDKGKLRLGIQKKDAVVDDVPANAAEVTFTVALVVREGEDGNPDFAGPYVHGKAGERFIYLSWGERTGDDWEILRRAKLHLNHLQWADLRGESLAVSLDMTDAKGGPLCASVRGDIARWVL